MNEQPEALRLADDLCRNAPVSGPTADKAAAELRRLNEVNQELLGALAWIDNRCPVHLMDHPLHNIHKEMAHDAGARARYAIAKATGETK